MPRLQLKGINLIPARESFDPIETASRDEIAALQLERLKWTLGLAYNNVAHYKKAFDKAGVHPDDLKALDDLPRFPFTAKDDLRAHYPFGMFAIPRDQVLRVQRRSHARSSRPQPANELGIRRSLEVLQPVLKRATRPRPAAS